jgi:hypothetical protein
VRVCFSPFLFFFFFSFPAYDLAGS